MYNTRDLIKKELEKLFLDENWPDEFRDFFPEFKSDVIWIMVDWVREGKYIEEALEIAELYIDDSDPTIESPYNQDILKGEEVRGIGTVRGSLAWLIQAVIARFNPILFARIITLLGRLSKDKVHYVRLQATYPLHAFMVNIYATKNQDGTPFNFLDEDRERVKGIAFNMLEENKNYPRILESLTMAFDRLRFLSEEVALKVVLQFLYQKENEFYPVYVTEKVAPLLIYLAEFRKDDTPTFNSEKFENLLKKVIKESGPELRATITWHIWKTIESNTESYVRLKKYTTLLMEGDFNYGSIGQYDLLIEQVLKVSPQDGVDLFKKELDFIEKRLPHIQPEPGGRVWFYNAEEAIEKLAELEPASLPRYLQIIHDIYLKKGYIGEVKTIFSAYKKVSVDSEKELESTSRSLYESLRRVDNHLPPL